MAGFYNGVILLGMALMLAALIWMILDKKRSRGYIKKLEEKLEEKKEELVGIINDAEQIIVELNKFSDYIITQVNKKNEELAATLKEFEEKVNDYKSLPVGTPAVGTPSGHMVDDGSTVHESIKAYDIASESIESEHPLVSAETENTPIQNEEEKKIIHLNSRYREVLNLSRKGYTQTDIAKSLNMGKGEIKLIIEMNK